MAARPPPARPHIAVNPSNRFSSYSIPDWAEDDAWDSGSDPESPSTSSWQRSSSRRGSAAATAPKPVPRPKLNNSSSTLAFSYTHVSAPSPSSYPSRQDVQPPKNGWTMVRKSTDRRQSIDSRDLGKPAEGGPYDDVEGDMIVGDLEPEVVEQAVGTTAFHSKPRQDQGSVRDDAEEIVNGTLRPSHAITKLSSNSQIHCISFVAVPQNDHNLSREQSGRTLT